MEKCINARMPKQLQKCLEMLNNGIAIDSIVKVINSESQLNVDAQKNVFEISTQPYMDGLTPGISKVLEYESSFYVVKVDEVKPSEPKALNEARGPIISKYQEHLEEEWIKALRAKYPISIDKDVLYSIQK